MPDRSWRATNIKFSLMKKTSYLMVGTILLANVLNVSAQGTTRKIITEKKTSQGRMVDPQSEVITAPQIAELEPNKMRHYIPIRP